MMGLRSVLALAALALGACDSSDPAQTAPSGNRAEGEVLGGTISDDMIPLDSLRSQSPPLRPAADAATGEAGDNAASTASGDNSPDEGADADGPAADPEPADEPAAADEE